MGLLVSIYITVEGGMRTKTDLGGRKKERIKEKAERLEIKEGTLVLISIHLYHVLERTDEKENRLR